MSVSTLFAALGVQLALVRAGGRTVGQDLCVQQRPQLPFRLGDLGLAGPLGTGTGLRGFTQRPFGAAIWMSDS